MDVKELDFDEVMGSKVWKWYPVIGFHASSVKTSNSKNKE